MQERNAVLLQSRRDDPVNRNVETLVKNLNAAYAKYHEIVKNCAEGLKVLILMCHQTEQISDD